MAQTPRLIPPTRNTNVCFLETTPLVEPTDGAWSPYPGVEMVQKYDWRNT